MYVTIDPYYDHNFYNQTKEALKNNGVVFGEYISTKTPFEWYFKVDQTPIMVNYDLLDESNVRWLVSKVIPLRPTDEYKLLRRDNDVGPNMIAKFIENTPLKEASASPFAIFFTVSNKEEILQISKDYPGKIWYFGKYYNNKFRVCLATNETIKNFIPKEKILLERTKDLINPGRFEAELNWKVFRGHDMLVKFTETPYFENGIYNRPGKKGDTTVGQGKFLI